MSGLLAMLVALLAAGGAFFAGRILLASAARYQQTFEDAASHNLADMFLFIEPDKLFVVNVIALALIFVAVFLTGGGIVAATLVAAAAGASPPVIYRLLHRRRRRRAINQLPDALLSIANNMGAGLSLSQALETTIAFERPPLGQELALVLRELRVGVPFSEAMEHLYQRLPEVEVQLVTAAMTVSREIGGNLSETLGRISDSLRKRLQMEGKIRSLTAQGRLQGIVMTVLPVFLVIVLTRMEPRAMHYLFHAWYGWVTLGVIATLELIGYHFIYRIVNIDV